MSTESTVGYRVNGADPTILPAAAIVADQSLGELLVAMQAAEAAVREAAWAACYTRYHRLVWHWVFHVLRSIPWLDEPGEVAADVTSDLFVALPEAAARYSEQGKAEAWLKHVAVRAALRRRESLTGRWASGRHAGNSRAGNSALGRRYVPIDEGVEALVHQLDAVTPEDVLDLERRRETLRRSSDPTRRRWAEFIDLYIAGYGFAEIGQRLGLTEASARNWLWKIRKYLAQPCAEECERE